MRPRGRWAVGLVVVLLGVPAFAGAAGPTATAPQSQVTLSLPGSFQGCSYLAPTTNDTLRALLDLVRPSAFVTTVQGDLAGAAGPISQAQLISLSPQTVAYTLSPGWHWSDGRLFTANDLLYWYQHAVHVKSAQTDGYRAIATLSVSTDGLTVTAVFREPFAMWNTLFRDINERGTPPNCQLSSVAGQGSLGPYELQSLSPNEAVLTRNPHWLGTPARLSTIFVHTDVAPVVASPTPSVDYRMWASLNQLGVLAGDPRRSGHVGTSNQVVVVGFSPHRGTTFQLAVRQFLALSIDRQSLVNQIVGPITYNQGLADSVIYSQGQLDYPGTQGAVPAVQAATPLRTTIPTDAGTDCTLCAPTILKNGGFVHLGRQWRDLNGHVLRLQMAVGPSPIDQAAASLIVAQWKSDGVPTTRISVSSESEVARQLALGHVDTGVMTIATGSQPATTARSWTGVNYGDGSDIGWRSPLIDQWYAAAQDTFNPRDAVSSFAEIDQFITTQEWERPLFTEPSVLTWSTDVQGVYQTSSLVALMDEIPSWGIAPPAKAPPTKR